MKIMHAHSPITVGVLVVTVIVAAMMVWWFGSRTPVPTVNAQEAIGKACEDLAAAGSYDATVRLAGQNSEYDEYNDTVIVIEANVSGADHQGTLTVTEGEGVGDYAKYVFVDGTYYYRDYTPGQSQQWSTDEGSPLIGVIPFSFLGANPACPDVEALTEKEWKAYNALGEEQVDGVTTQHFADSGPLGAVGVVDGSMPVGTIEHDYRHHFWIDNAGSLVQAKVEILTLFQTVEGASPQEVRGEFLISISGVGEPNVITAPTVPAQ